MNLYVRRVCVAGIAALAISAHASTAPGPGDAVAGKQKAQVCFACHGIDGNSSDPSNPKLAGQHAEYIVQELLAFKLGRRKDAVMEALARSISSHDDLQDIAAYFASLPTMRGSTTDETLARRGEQLFIQERCVFCHGEGAKPNSPFVPGAPIIGGQHKQYLMKTMLEIRAGNRSGDIYDLMYKTLKGLSEQDIEAIAEYLGGL